MSQPWTFTSRLADAVALVAAQQERIEIHGGKVAEVKIILTRGQEPVIHMDVVPARPPTHIEIHMSANGQHIWAES